MDIDRTDGDAEACTTRGRPATTASMGSGWSRAPTDGWRPRGNGRSTTTGYRFHKQLESAFLWASLAAVGELSVPDHVASAV